MDVITTPSFSLNPLAISTPIPAASTALCASSRTIRPLAQRTQMSNHHTPFLKYHRPINIRTHTPPHQEIISYCQNHRKTIIPIVVKNETVSIRVGEFNKTADKHR